MEIDTNDNNNNYKENESVLMEEELQKILHSIDNNIIIMKSINKLTNETKDELANILHLFDTKTNDKKENDQKNIPNKQIDVIKLNEKKDNNKNNNEGNYINKKNFTKNNVNKNINNLYFKGKSFPNVNMLDNNAQNTKDKEIEKQNFIKEKFEIIKSQENKINNLKQYSCISILREFINITLKEIKNNTINFGREKYKIRDLLKSLNSVLIYIIHNYQYCNYYKEIADEQHTSNFNSLLKNFKNMEPIINYNLGFNNEEELKNSLIHLFIKCINIEDNLLKKKLSIILKNFLNKNNIYKLLIKNYEIYHATIINNNSNNQYNK